MATNKPQPPTKPQPQPQPQPQPRPQPSPPRNTPGRTGDIKHIEPTDPWPKG
jgi:hypothetical protein